MFDDLIAMHLHGLARLAGIGHLASAATVRSWSVCCRRFSSMRAIPILEACIIARPCRLDREQLLAIADQRDPLDAERFRDRQHRQHIAV